MEERTYTKRDVRPQPKIGSLVVAFDYDDFKRQKTRREFIYVHQDENSTRGWTSYTGRVPVGSFGVVVKGDGKGYVYVAFGGGVIGWVEVEYVAPLDWYERITAPVQSND